MNKIFIDESGYTGFDLLNKDQPFQGASSLQIDEDSARVLVDKYFPDRKTPELKHGKLSRRKNNWKNLLNIQKDILDNYMGFTYICNKKYLLTLMFLDTCLEPFFHDKGKNFYEDGHNYSLASLIYYTAPTFWGDKNYDELLYLFQRAVKSKSNVAVLALVEKARSLNNKELSNNLFPLTIEYSSCLREIKIPESNTDAAFVVLLSLITHIEKYIPKSYEIVHDTSDNLLKYDELLRWFRDPNKTGEFSQTMITSIKFPLKLSSISQIDSRNSYGVQLADILVGGMVEYSMAQKGLVKKTEYNQSVINLYGDRNLIHMLPSLNFNEDKAFRSGTKANEFIDFMSKNYS